MGFNLQHSGLTAAVFLLLLVWRLGLKFTLQGLRVPTLKTSSLGIHVYKLKIKTSWKFTVEKIGVWVQSELTYSTEEQRREGHN